MTAELDEGLIIEQGMGRANPAPRKMGGVALTHALDDTGGVRSEFKLTRLADGHFYVISAAAAEDHDHDLLRALLPADGSVRLQRATREWGTIFLTGPNARNVLSELTRADLSNTAFPWLFAQTIEVAGFEVRALRVSFVGELGWELHHRTQDQAALYVALIEVGADHGLRCIGLRAMDCLRIEKFYRNWRSDLNTEYSLLESGMQRFCQLGDDRDFRGKAALLALAASPPKRSMVCLEINSPGAHAIGSEPVLAAGKIIGITTSGAFGMRVGKSLALAYVEAEFAVDGQALEVDLLGQRLSATMHLAPVYDPKNARLKS